MSRTTACMLAVMVGCALLLPAAAQTAQDHPTQMARADKPTLPAGTAVANDSMYQIGAQDVLNVSVWKEPDLSGPVPVRPDGMISLPLINDVQASGLTPMQLSDLLSTKLKKYLAEPRVTVIVTAMNSQRIYILGEVSRPGAFPLLPNMTALQALSSAGGFTQFADMKNIYVLRNDNGRQQKFPLNYKEVVKGARPEQNIPLKPGDTIVVP
jgi:polysaccharide biosynthesis/export protein